MSKTFRPYDPEQQLLLPAALQECPPGLLIASSESAVSLPFLPPFPHIPPHSVWDLLALQEPSENAQREYQ